ncbi:MAG: hypothetical protein ACYCSQ_09410 [bacterium]
MLKKIKIILILSLAVFIGFGTVKSEAKMMRKNKMMKMKMFFMHHSVGFFPVFFKHHPGPMWILKNAKALNLTKLQISREVALKKAMFQKTKNGIMELKAAIKEYKITAKQYNPSIKELMVREQAVGNAETYLGGVMIPYHIKAFRILNASQRVEFKKLAIMSWKKMKAKMKIMHKMMMIHVILKSCRKKLKMLHKKMKMLHNGNGRRSKKNAMY